jgi:hypothetical protein
MSDSEEFSPIQIQASSTLTITVWDIEREARLTITMDGDVDRLVPHLSRIVNDVVEARNAD